MALCIGVGVERVIVSEGIIPGKSAEMVERLKRGKNMFPILYLEQLRKKGIMQHHI